MSFENEDVILPDDFEETATEETGTEDQPQSLEEETETTLEEGENTNEPTPEEITQSLKVKFLGEEKEVPIEEAIPLIQKGMNYDRLQSKINEFENDPRIAFVDSLAKENGMTITEFMDAVKEQKYQDEINQLVQANIPEEYAREMIESKRFREQMKAESEAKQKENQQNEELTSFLDYFKESNGRDFDPSKDELPSSVWEANKKGVPLRFAYAEHKNRELQAQLKQLKTNEKNKKMAPGLSTTSHGSNENVSEDEFLSGFNSI